jgi:hypothetical protein
LKTTTVRFNTSFFVVTMRATVDWRPPIVTRFIFLMLERHHVAGPTSARSLAAPVPAL